MSIKQYISDLLFNYDVVIIPGFGGFATNTRPAIINDNSFLPPFKEIMFNSDLKNNDGILISSIVKNEGISQSQALEKINDFVLITQNNLQAKKTVVIDGVGSLKLGKENKIAFMPDNSVNYLLEAYGLTSFNSPLIEFDETNKEAIKTILAHRYTKRLAVSLPLIIALLLIPLKSNFIKNTSSLSIFPSYTNEQPLDYNKVTQNSNTVEGAIDDITKNKTALYYKNNDESTSKNTNKVVEIEPEKEIIKTPEIVKEETKPEITKEEKVEIKTEKPTKKAVKKTENKATKRYCLIAGSFQTNAKAKKQVKKLKKYGITAEILKSGGRYRVSAQSFDNKSKARAKSKEIKKLHNISSWVFDRK